MNAGKGRSVHMCKVLIDAGQGGSPLASALPCLEPAGSPYWGNPARSSTFFCQGNVGGGASAAAALARWRARRLGFSHESRYECPWHPAGMLLHEAADGILSRWVLPDGAGGCGVAYGLCGGDAGVSRIFRGVRKRFEHAGARV